MVLAALRAAGALDNMVDDISPPATSKLWLDKNFDPGILKEWDPIGSSWVEMSFHRLFERAAISNITLTGGTANALVANAPALFFSNRLYSITPTIANAGGGVTLQITGVGTFAVTYPDGAALAANEFAASRPETMVFRNGRFEVLFSTAELNAAVIAATAAATAAEAAAASIPGMISAKADKATTIGAGGLATGGGDLSASRTITVTKSSNAQAIAGTDDATAMTPTRVRDAVDGVPVPLGNNTLYKSMATKDRWLRSYRLADELQFTGGGALATDAAIIEAMFNRCKAAGRGELILPRGDIKLEQSCALLNTTGNMIAVRGQGEGATRFLNSSATQLWFQIGGAAGRSNDITLEGFTATANVTMTSGGSVFFVRNTTDIVFQDIVCRGVGNGWSLGVGASQTNDVVYTSILNCAGGSGGASTVPMIRLGSGGILQIGGNAHRWNANGSHEFMVQDDNTWNWDGLYVYDQFFEHFTKYLSARGKGVVNAEWTGGQVDRADVFFQAEPLAGGNCRNWNIHDVQILGFPGSGGGIGFLSSGSIESMRIVNNKFDNLTDAAVYASTGEAIVNGNEFINCANLGVSAPLGGAVVRIGQGFSRVINNTARRPSGSAGAAYRYGIQWDGASTGIRDAGPSGSNSWYGFGAAATTGTM